MKKFAIAAMVLMPSVALAQNISGSLHDLSSTGGASVKATNTTRICVFCHIPHGAETGATAIWNRNNPATVTAWGASETATAYGTTLPITLTSANAGTIRCMSCHDGTTTMGAMRNAPTPAPDNAASTLSGAYDVNGTAGSEDMSGNHPVGVPYPISGGGAVYNSVNSAVTGAQFTAQWVAAPASPIRLYPGPDVGDDSGVECGSCHDPHGPLGPNTAFLRVQTNNSDLCKACHNK